MWATVSLSAQAWSTGDVFPKQTQTLSSITELRTVIARCPTHSLPPRSLAPHHNINPWFDQSVTLRACCNVPADAALTARRHSVIGLRHSGSPGLWCIAPCCCFGEVWKSCIVPAEISQRLSCFEGREEKKFLINVKKRLIMYENWKGGRLEGK